MSAKLLISPVRVPKAANLLANQLRSNILSGEWQEGALLPSERELVAQAGLSRASVREALRILEMEGLVVIRPGRGGGSAVCRPSREALERSVSLFIRGQRLRPEALLETREALEAIIARLAAENRTEADLASMNGLHGELIGTKGDHARFLHANLVWHLAVARASHNELLAGFSSAVSREIFRDTMLDVLSSDQVHADTVRAHARIMKAISERDREAASRRMTRHLRAYVGMILGNSVLRTSQPSGDGSVSTELPGAIPRRHRSDQN
jgi:GntR family transcriptional regulator, transcriptional repressor for pyruvate dehydrogenase complex